jgi:hypothetical protein
MEDVMEKQSSLIAHCGATVVTFADLQALPNPERMGSRHLPVRHDHFVTALQEVLADRGYVVAREQYAIQTDAAKLFGLLDFTRKDEERGVALGFRHGNDQSMPMTIVAGSRVFVCDNMALSGEEVVLKRKHTTGFDIRIELTDAAGRFIDAYARFDQRLAQFKAHGLSDQSAKKLIYDAFISGDVLPMRHIIAVDQWYFHGPEGATDTAPRSVWGLHNAFTRTIKEVGGLNNQAKAATAVTRYLEATIH